MPIDPNRIQAVFLLAVEASGTAARVEVVNRECGADAELRERVEALLAAHDAYGGFLDRPQVSPFSTVDEPRQASPFSAVDEPRRIEGPGGRIGPYKLLQQIGEGGMGVVYLAEQLEPVQRKVALKVIKPGMDTHQVVARFEAERQALALMDHPNIAKVLDAGATDSGRPYFVMELVKGLPITKYCDQEHLTPQERLHLFVPICQAVQHAHQKGIIHRDLKPSNILIALYDGKPVPKVIDFGVAKATGTKLTERTLFTEVGHAIGTWEYMAPEQAEVNNLDIDTRADVYALGATLYELLTGSPPFTRQQLRKAAFADMLHMIREVEPPKPSTRLSSSDELPSLAAKRKLEPAKLSQLVRGDLDWIVMKCLEKERGRRYETANGLAMDVQRYLADEPVLASPPSAAYRLRKFARRNKGKLLTAALVGFVLLFAAGSVGWGLWDRAEQRAINRSEKTFQVRQNHAIAETSLARLSDLYKQYLWTEAAALLAGAEKLVGPDGDPDLRERIAKAKRKTQLFHDLDEARLAGTTWVEGKFNVAGAAVQYASAFRTFGLDVKPGQTEALARRIREQEPSVREALLIALDDWVYLDRIAMSDVLIALLAAADDDSWRQEYHKVAAAGDGAALVRLSEQARRLPLAPTNLERLARALEVCDRRDEAVALLRWARTLYPADFWIALNLGNLLETKEAAPGVLEERVGCYRVAVALRPLSSAAHANLGSALSHKHPLDNAIAEYKIAIQLDRKNVVAHTNYGLALRDKKQWDDAIAEFKKAIEIDSKYMLAHHSYGLALHDKKQWDDAIAEFKKAIEIDSKYGPAHANLGSALYRKRQLDDAIAEYKIAIQLDTKNVVAHYNLGLALHAKNQLDDAIAEFHKAIALDPKFAMAHVDLGIALHAKNRLDDAIAEFHKASALDPQLAVAHYNLGVALKRKNQLDDAIAEYKKAIAIDPKDASAHNSLGSALAAKNQWDDAITEFKKAIDLDPKDVSAHNNLGSALAEKNQWDDAITEFNKAIDLDPKDPLAHLNIGIALRTKKQLDAAIAELKKAIDFDPKVPRAYYELGIALRAKNQLGDAEAAYGEAIKIDPNYAEAYCNLGLVLRLLGRLADSRKAYQRGHTLGTQRGSAWRYNSAKWVADAERLVKLEARLPTVLIGKDRVADSTELEGLREVCRLQKRFLTAAKLFDVAFSAAPKLASDLNAGYRYDAACYAALAAAGLAADADKLDDKARTLLRKQALDWLRADLDLWRKRQADAKLQDRQALRQTLKLWQEDTDLIGIHDATALEKLPADEREACQKLWAEVAEVLKKANAGK